ncbi:MAG: ParB/RepB/Spo0J family partition protein, partial [Limisphaerales bacterium]
MKTENLKLDQIIMNAGTQTRASIHEETVVDYAEAMRNGAKFPPVIVFNDSGKFLLADGYHRVAAVKLNKGTEIAAEIREGSRIDAIKFALSANATNGLRRTSADKRNCVIIALKEFPDLSNRAIADQCGVSDMLVKDVRSEQVPDSGSSVRIAKNGKKFRMKRSAVRSKPAQRNGNARVGQVKTWFKKAKPEMRGELVCSIFT